MLVAFTGFAGSGKDTAADYFAQKMNLKRYYFAKPIYEAVASMLDTTVDWLKDRNNKEVLIPEIGKSPREILQLFGTEFGRDMINKDLWIILANRFYHKHGRVCISDCRFINEAKWVKDNGGFLIQIVRPNNQDGTDRSSHISEMEMQTQEFFDMVDLTIYNVKDLNNFYNALDGVIDYYESVFEC